jgi:hypothetical protein
MKKKKKNHSTARILPAYCLPLCTFEHEGNLLVLISSPTPSGLLGLDHMPWSGVPNPTWLVGPVTLRNIKRWGCWWFEVRGSPQSLSPLTTLTSIYRGCTDSDGKPPPSSPPPPRHHHDARAAVTPSSPSTIAARAQSPPTNKMAATGSSSNATAPSTDGLHHLTSSSLSTSLSDPVELVLGLVYTEMQMFTPLIYSIWS